MKARLGTWLAAALLVAAGCGGDGGSGAEADADATGPTQDVAAGDAADASDAAETGDWCQGPEDCDADAPVCDPGTGACVACLFDLHCTPTERCVDLACVPADTCGEPGVDCEAAAAPPCQEGCLPCEQDSWCPGIYHCEEGRCVLDVCHEDEGTCTDGGLIACDPRGTGWTDATPCPAKHTCEQDGWEAHCAEWKCEPGGTCQGDTLVACAEDGLDILESVDCADQDALCVEGECKPVLCEADETFCDPDDLTGWHECNGDGTDFSTFTCPGPTFCLSGDCVPQACQPGQPTCNFDSVSTCDEFGSGPIDEGTPCAENQKCWKGECQEVVCEAETFECIEGATVLAKCNSLGTGYSTTTPCPTGTTCQDGADGPGCSAP